VFHVAGGIDVDEHADEGDDQQHYDRELVHLQGKIHAERSGDHPGEIISDEGDLIRGEMGKFANQLRDRQKGQCYRADSHGVYGGPRPELAEQAIDRSTRQGQRENDPKMVE
jgi:hypothetical protein